MASTQSIRLSNNAIILNVTATADADSESFDLTDLDLPFIPTIWTVVSSRIVGATDTVAVDFQGSVLGIEWADIVAQITDTEGTVTTNPVESAAVHSIADFTASDNVRKAFLHVRVLVTTIGSGNTLSITAVGVR